ncbi:MULTISPECIES: Co2+/Mg2+ efflux protein ApaG [Tenacibaculum]|uniref:Co2+/Mg2+ efflux protein ApaG n=1 Tax=Tenacibaculum aiptasiae TaxID=426481 RepID=A0A7J5AEB8_9FLAO|nr:MULTISPECIES: Co2+/Mg2+ efflux protein ApaG [Tenacibaculum]KAB1155912.1 Co2+/Mg2+ efflux protein ApaG [Tenacibaculum aiptasiae]MCF2875914.1 Co2+/Mg2+ efflux protein ApaG [Tenacibaculum sp. Cn5-1]MCF2935989.1 Co2+/Mg2+ efflux protein ApaG [Tenacibaculum sp. Cn5-34]MCG7512550.1 Co2+/Mg2+ efflux protein ApaG [Tenacibaculum sp. Cn5-46]
MFQQITRGIKISVKTTFNGPIYHANRFRNAFSYYISIENTSKDTVKLLGRFWTIFDALSNVEYVEGRGVVGETPTLKPNESYSYKSNCFLLSSLGAMKGNYKMINFETSEEFLVTIPTFQLTTTPTLN